MYGLIDIGSNTIRLALYTVKEGQIKMVLSKKNTASLASLIGPGGALSAEGVSRLLEVLEEFAESLSCVTTEAVYVFATASLRNVTNASEVCSLVRSHTGLNIQVISGEQEGLFDYYSTLLTHAPQEGLIIDVGGGSTELIPVKEGKPLSVTSVPVGSLNLYKKHVDRLLPTREEYEKIKAQLKTQLRPLPLADTIYCVGGSARGLIRLKNRLYGPGDHMDRMKPKTLKKILELTFADPRRAERLIADILSDRLRTLLTGAAVIMHAAEAAQAKELVVCPYGVREGYLHYALNKPLR